MNRAQAVGTCAVRQARECPSFIEDKKITYDFTKEPRLEYRYASDLPIVLFSVITPFSLTISQHHETTKIKPAQNTSVVSVNLATI